MENEDSAHYEHQDHHETSHKKRDMTEKIRTNPWIMSTFVLGILAIILIVGSVSGGITGKTISEKEAGELVVKLAKSQIGDIEILDVSKESGFYKIDYESEKTGKSFIYLTLDGNYLIGGLTSLAVEEEEEEPEPVGSEIPKEDIPKVELFVVSYCPYGIGAEKGFLPVMELLKDKADLQITFMHTQHGEKEDKENKLQICLREEQESKYLNYLGCFLEDGNSERCLVQAKIDKAKLDTCLGSKIEKYHLEDISSTEKYGITGSPSLIINGVKANIPQLKDRTPTNFLNLVCSAFNEKPEECSNVLSLEIQSPQFGYSSDSDSSSGGQC